MHYRGARVTIKSSKSNLIAAFNGLVCKAAAETGISKLTISFEIFLRVLHPCCTSVLMAPIEINTFDISLQIART